MHTPTRILALLALPVGALVHALPDVADPDEPRVQSPDSRPIDGLTSAQIAGFAQGEAEFLQRWVVAPSPFGRWGRGPTSNAEKCSDCHTAAARGAVRPGTDVLPQAMIVRLSMPGKTLRGAPLPHPNYGDQLQTLGVLGKVPGEGDATLEWTEHTATYADGTRVTLHAPRVRLSGLNFGSLGTDTMISVRLAPALRGLGLLGAVSDETLLGLARSQRAQGLNGRANLVWSEAAQRATVGRFGLKASQPDLRQQIAHAYHADLGVTSTLFPEDNCTVPQASCRSFPRAGRAELTDAQLDAITFYVAVLAPPTRPSLAPDEVRRGQAMFLAAGCADCHAPVLSTGEYRSVPQLAHLELHAYTDLLLHDLGDGLADGRPDFAAGSRDWRTAPLWGLGRAVRTGEPAAMLHDGRAPDAAAAILWHGGEAQPSREAFRNLTAVDRRALLRFLESL